MIDPRLPKRFPERWGNHTFAPLDAAIVATGAIGLACLGLAALRCLWNPDLNFNEGWNAYYQMAALQGRNVYPPNDALIFNNYPPLSFILIGLISRLDGGDVIMVGRILSLCSISVIAINCGLIVNNLSNHSIRGGFTAVVVCLAGLCLIFPHYIGMNDPQFLGEAFMTTAMSIYTRDPERTSFLCLTLILIAVAGMIKHNILAVPLAIALDALLRSPRRALNLLILSVALLLVCALWLHAVSDGRVWSSLLARRTYSFIDAVKLLRDFLESAFTLVFIGAIGIVGRLDETGPRLVATYILFSLVLGGLFGGGAGTATNMYFDTVIASALAVGLLTANLIQSHSGSVAGLSGVSFAALLIVGAILESMFHDTWRLTALLPDNNLAKATQDDIAYLRSRPGDAICASATLCFRAGKSFLLDLFNANQAERTGAISSVQFINLMKGGQVKTVELNQAEADIVVANEPSLREGSTFLNEVGTSYTLDRQGAGHAFFVWHGQ